MAKDTYIVTLDDSATDEQIKHAKDQVKKQGGEIGEDFKISFTGFEVKIDKGSVHTFDSIPSVKAVENTDGTVSTQ